MQHQNLVPVALLERIQTIDIIRGVALFGILIINFTVDHRALDHWTEKPLIDQFVYWPITFFIDEKFRAIYCFLFGLGFSIQMLRAEAHNAPFVFIYIRRLIVLYIIGLANQILTGHDILHNYAMVGVILLILHKLPRKLLLFLALLCFFVSWTRNHFFQTPPNPSLTLSQRNTVTVDSTILDRYVGVYEIAPGRRSIITREGNKLFGEGRGGRVEWLPDTEQDFFLQVNNAHFSFVKDSTGEVIAINMQLANGEVVVARRIQMEIPKAQKEMVKQRADLAKKRLSPSYKEFVVKNANDFWIGLKNWSWKRFFWYGTLTETLPLFLIGLYFGGRRIFYEVASNRRFLKRVTKFGLLVGLTMVTIATVSAVLDYFNISKESSYSKITKSLIDLCWTLGSMVTAIAYVAGLALILEKVNWQKRLALFTPVGRMGLTNYLLQTTASTLILNYGLKLTTLGVFGRMMLALPVFFLLVFLSHCWFKHFRIGPMEWFWRSLTYLKFQPMRLKQTDKSQEKKN